MGDPKITVSFLPNKMDIQLEEGERITGRMLERMAHMVHKTVRGARMQSMMRRRKEDAIAAASTADPPTAEPVNNEDLTEREPHVIKETKSDVLAELDQMISTNN